MKETAINDSAHAARKADWLDYVGAVWGNESTWLNTAYSITSNVQNAWYGGLHGLQNSVAASTYGANMALWRASLANDTTEDAIGFANSVWTADMNYQKALETNRLNYQIAWRQEEIAKLPTNDPRRTALLGEIALLQNTKTAYTGYMTPTIAAGSDYLSASQTAYGTYKTEMVSAIDTYMAALDLTETGCRVGSQAAELSYATGVTSADRARDLALFDAARNEAMENAIKELAVAQANASASGSAASQASSLASNGAVSTQAERDALIASLNALAGAENTARGQRETQGNQQIAATKTAAAATKTQADQQAELQHKNSLMSAQAGYLAGIFGVSATYMQGLLNNMNTSIASAQSKYAASMKTAADAYGKETCRLGGLYSDAMQKVSGGGTIDANFYSNGASSVNVQVCFAAGFEIDLTDGSLKNIEDFAGGEEIWARPHDNPTGPLQKCKVVRAFKNGFKETMLLKFDNGLELRGTAEHPFYVGGKGWTPLGELESGDTCFDREQNPVVVKEIIRDGKVVEVFNIEVEGCHTYYIGRNGLEVLVHNVCSCGRNHDGFDWNGDRGWGDVDSGRKPGRIPVAIRGNGAGRN